MYSGVEPSTGPSVIMPTNLGGHVLRRLGFRRATGVSQQTSTWSSRRKSDEVDQFVAVCRHEPSSQPESPAGVCARATGCVDGALDGGLANTCSVATSPGVSGGQSKTRSRRAAWPIRVLYARPVAIWPPGYTRPLGEPREPTSYLRRCRRKTRASFWGEPAQTVHFWKARGVFGCHPRLWETTTRKVDGQP